ncbi:MAG: DNA alkylation repair protein [Rhodospirillales bacterium]|nr:MAG: DNA alkylation repair protein [Rhodospirillales bacterium]
MQRFFQTGPGEYGEGDLFAGLRVPQVRAFARAYRDISLDDMTAVLQSGYHEARFLALVLLADRFRRGDEAEQAEIYRRYLAHTRFINNWDLVDSSARHIVGAWLAQRDRAPLYRLARSADLWERRIAIIATQAFIRDHDFADTLKIAEMLRDDPHDLIHKAVGWMLREVGNRDRAAEEEFLERHCRQMPRTMLRYAIEKFPPTLRRRYLDGTVGP